MGISAGIEQHTAQDKKAKLPEGWRMVRFGDVVRHVQVNVNSQESGLDRYVAGEHMETDNLHIKQWGTVGDSYLGPAFHRKFVKGQVLYGSRRTYLRKVAMAEFDGICANTTFTLESYGDQLLPELLPFIMQTESFTEHSIKQSRGSVNPYINWKDIASYEFPLPPKDEQRRITGILWAADENLHRSEIFVEGIISFRSVFLDQILEKGLFSSNWATVQFGSLMTCSPRSGYSAVSSSRDTGHYVLSLSAISRSGYQKGHLKPVELTPEVENAILHKDDFLISRSNTNELVGLVGIFNEDRTDISFPDTMMLVNVDEKKVDKHFLQWILLSKLGRSQIRRIAGGTSASMKKINRSGLSSILIPMPPTETQLHIVNMLASCTNAIYFAEHKKNSCHKLRDALRERLLTNGI